MSAVSPGGDCDSQGNIGSLLQDLAKNHHQNKKLVLNLATRRVEDRRLPEKEKNSPPARLTPATGHSADYQSVSDMPPQEDTFRTSRSKVVRDNRYGRCTGHSSSGEVSESSLASSGTGKAHGVHMPPTPTGRRTVLVAASELPARSRRSRRDCSPGETRQQNGEYTKLTPRAQADASERRKMSCERGNHQFRARFAQQTRLQWQFYPSLAHLAIQPRQCPMCLPAHFRGKTLGRIFEQLSAPHLQCRVV